MGRKSTEIARGVFQVGGDGLSGSGDCMVYAVDCGPGSLALVDCGVASYPRIRENLRGLDLDPSDREEFVCFLTHCHIDHVGAAHQVRGIHPHVKFMAHEGDIAAIEGAPGTGGMTAASWYGVKYVPVQVDVVGRGGERVVEVGGVTFHAVHTPGHTPGSMVVYADIQTGGGEQTRVLFGQDIHGPFMREFGSDLGAYRMSMGKLLELDADILCEGHFGIIRGAGRVREFIEGYLEANS
ncbi:MAG: MBL fold metallo-hydrolase [Promethearchaeota archaeon]